MSTPTEPDYVSMAAELRRELGRVVIHCADLKKAIAAHEQLLPNEPDQPPEEV